VDVILRLGFQEVNKRFEEWTDRLKDLCKKKGAEKEDKQIVPMALILLADEISEQELFKDGIRLNVEKCFEYLKDKNSVSENRRAYDYLRDSVLSNPIKFNPDDNGEYRSGCWGKWLDDKKCAIIPSIMQKLLSDGGYQYKTFISWATRENLLKRETSKQASIKIDLNGKRTRCIVIDLSVDFEENDDFISISEDLEDDLPFT
jgi:hypothetical protein